MKRNAKYTKVISREHQHNPLNTHPHPQEGNTLAKVSSPVNMRGNSDTHVVEIPTYYTDKNILNVANTGKPGSQMYPGLSKDTNTITMTTFNLHKRNSKKGQKYVKVKKNTMTHTDSGQVHSSQNKKISKRQLSKMEKKNKIASEVDNKINVDQLYNNTELGKYFSDAGVSEQQLKDFIIKWRSSSWFTKLIKRVTPRQKFYRAVGTGDPVLIQKYTTAMLNKKELRKIQLEYVRNSAAWVPVGLAVAIALGGINNGVS